MTKDLGDFVLLWSDYATQPHDDITTNSALLCCNFLKYLS